MPCSRSGPSSVPETESLLPVLTASESGVEQFRFGFSEML